MTDTSQTKRLTIPEMEEILYEPYPVLDKGFIRVVDYMGGDSSIVQAARVSYGKGTKQVRQDAGLINYLIRNRHTTPLEMCEIKFHVKLPIFVARQWIRHRTASVNEYSARYSVMEQEFYLPDREHIAHQSTLNSQGRGAMVDEEQANFVMELLQHDASNAYKNYNKMLESDIARELARINLNLSYYTQWYWKINLHNLLHFLKLRADPHAQYEIGAYATVMLDILKSWVPITYEAFVNYYMNSFTLSAKSINVIKSIIQGKKPRLEDSEMSKREWNELINALDIKPHHLG